MIADTAPYNDFVPSGQSARLIDLPVTAKVRPEWLEHREKCDWCVAVRWIYAFDRREAVLRNRFRRPTFQPIKQPALVEELLAAFKALSPVHAWKQAPQS